MSCRKSKRLEKKEKESKSSQKYVMELTPLIDTQEDDEEIEIGSEDTSTGETSESDDSDYEPEPEENFSTDDEGRKKEDELRKFLLDRESVRQKNRIKRKTIEYFSDNNEE